MNPTHCRTGLLATALTLVVGCGGGTTATRPTTSNEQGPPTHNHPTVGPHGGPLVEWGEEELHLEVLIDRTAGTATLYVLAEDAKTAVPIATKALTLSLPGTPPTDVTLAADPQEGDAKDNGASRFVGKHDAFRNPGRLSGSVSGEKDGKKYTGKFRERAAKK